MWSTLQTYLPFTCRLRSKVVLGGASVDSRFRHSQKLEELRNIQEQISLERAQWTKEKDAQEKWIVEKKIEIQKKQVSSSEIINIHTLIFLLVS